MIFLYLVRECIEALDLLYYILDILDLCFYDSPMQRMNDLHTAIDT